MCYLCEMAKMRKSGGHSWSHNQYKYAGRVHEAEQAGTTLKDYMKGKPRWGSLHGHSERSLLDGGAKIEDIIDKAKAMGQDFVAITDHGNLFGAVQAHQYAKKKGIKHIVGCELYITPVGRSRWDKDFKKGEKAYHHLVVLAKNSTGYQNLCRLSSLGYSEGFYRAPRVDRELLDRYGEGLIVTSACVGGAIPANAMAGDFYKAEKELEWMLNRFGEDYYVEIQNHHTEYEDRAFTFMRELALKNNVPLIATTDSHYLDADDSEAHDALLCIGTGQYVDQPDRKFKFTGTGFHYQSQEEVEALFPGEQEAIFNTGRLADKIDDQVIDFEADTKIPPFDVPDDPEFKAWEAEGGFAKWLSN